MRATTKNSGNFYRSGLRIGRKGVNSIGLAVSHSRSQAPAWERPWACCGGAA
ncbi:MAG: hypothetical protein GDA48_12905 [Hormoscilla sp. GM102CHS1]|nr:hypothetical protein [Hormoscilla sp. GM102CHS1]